MSVKRHTAYNVAGAVVPLLATLVVLPRYLATIGEERYGVLVILWTILGYFGLFDLGLGRAVTNRVAMFRDGTALDREEVFWTALSINLVLGCLGALALWGVGSLGFAFFIKVPGGLAAEVREALPLMAVAFPLLLGSSVMSGALAGREEFLAQNLVGICTGLLIQVAPLVVALGAGPALPGLVAAVLSVRVLSALMLFAICVRRLPLGFRPRPARSHARALLGFGGWITLTSIVGPLLSTFDRVVIGVIAGAGAVTHYTVPFTLASRISIIPGSLSSALFPRFSSSHESERGVLLDSAIRSLVAIVTPLTVGGMLIMEPFLTWWVGAEFAAKAAPIGEILTLGVWANCLAYIPFALIQARGRPDLVAKFHLAELVPYVLLLWLALEWWGAAGAAVAWSLRVWVDAGLLFRTSRFHAPRVLAAGAAVMACAGVAAVLTSGTEAPGMAVRAAVLLGAVAWAWRVAPSHLGEGVQRLASRLRFAEAKV